MAWIGGDLRPNPRNVLGGGYWDFGGVPYWIYLFLEI